MANISKKRENLIIFLCVFLVLFINNISLPFAYGPFGWDESGYLAQASFLAGFRWDGVAGQIPYYSFGNSLIIFPLFLFIKDAVLLYKAILFLNSILVSLVFLLSYFFSKVFVEDDSIYKRIVVALIIALHPSNIGEGNSFLAENYILFIFFLLIFLYYQFLKTNKCIYAVLFEICSIYLFLIHQRAIVITVVGILFSVLMAIKAKRKQTVIILVSLLVSLALGVILIKVYKPYVKSLLWGKGLYDSSINDITEGNLSLLKILFQESFWEKFFTSMLGKVWYMIIESFGFAAVAIIYLFNILKKCLDKNKKHLLIYIYACWIGSLLAVSYFLYNPTRVDHVVFGRYMEPFFLPIMLIILSAFLNNEIEVKSWIIILLVLLGKISENCIYKVLEKTSYNETSSCRVIQFFLTDPYKEGRILLISFAAAILFLLLFKLNKNKMAVLMFILIFYLGIDLNLEILDVQTKKENGEIISETIENIQEGAHIAYLQSNTYANEIQFLRRDLTFDRIEMDDSAMSEEFDYILMRESQKEYLNQLDNYIVICNNSELCLVKIE